MPKKASYSHSQQHFRVFKTGTMGENVCVAGENKHFASFSLRGPKFVTWSSECRAIS